MYVCMYVRVCICDIIYIYVCVDIFLSILYYTVDNGWVVGWLVGWLAGWLVGWLVG